MSKVIDGMPWRRWQPKLFEALAMALGIASGVTPQAGIYTAIVGGFLESLRGGSRIQIGGPTGAFVVIVAGIVAAHGLPGLLMVTMMASSCCSWR